MKTLLDVHTHTVVSGHAYSSLQEMAREASNQGLEILGITEHGPSVPGTCDLLYFKNMHVVPRSMYGLKLMLGCECNILNTRGELDLNDRYLDMLDICIAGIHDVCWEGGTADENTAGMIAAIRNPKVDIISHPGDGTAQLHFEPLVIAAKEAHTLLEVNNHSLSHKRTKRAAALPNTLELLRLSKKYDVPVILGSDAHISFQIGDYSELLPLLAQSEFPDSLIVNYNPEQFLKYIGRK